MGLTSGVSVYKNIHQKITTHEHDNNSLVPTYQKKYIEVFVIIN